MAVHMKHVPPLFVAGDGEMGQHIKTGWDKKAT